MTFRTALCFTLCILCISSFSAQFVAHPNSIDIETPMDIIASPDWHDAHVHVYNTSDSTVRFYWRINGFDDPEDLQIGVKDNNICYNPGFLSTCALDLFVELPPGDSSLIWVWSIWDNTPFNEEPENFVGSIDIMNYPECDSSLINIPVTITPVSNLLSTEIQQLEIFPNPAYDNLYIGNSISDLSKYRFDVMGQGGRVVMKDIKLVQESIPLEGYSSGVYYLSVQKEDKIRILKFLKL